MEYVQAMSIKVAKRSRNKLTKKQLGVLRNHKWFMYERSYYQIMKRMHYIKACIRMQPDLLVYTDRRWVRLLNAVRKRYSAELKAQGILEANDSSLMLHFPKYRSIKLSLLSDTEKA